MSLRLQFIVPVLTMLVAVIGGWATGSTLSGAIVGTVAGLASAIFLARHAQNRLEELARLPSRSVPDARALLQPAGTFDEIDSARSAIARWLVAERENAELDRGQTDRQIRMLDRLSDGVMLVSEDGTVIYANVAAATLLAGRNPVGGSFIAAVRDHEASDALFACLREGVEIRRTIEVPGEDRVVEAIFARVSRDPREAVVVIRDVTELVKLQTLRRDFVANVSHELRTPLSTIKILTETIIELTEYGAEHMRFLEKIDGEVDSMSALVEDLLQLTQLESGRTPLTRRRVAANELVVEVLERMSPISERHRVRLRANPVDPEYTLIADDRRVKQALINLVNNAIVHTPEGGTVEIQCEPIGDDVVFRVVDTGVGIPAEDLDRIWERFYKVDRSRSHPGTGLGLAIVKHVAQAHGGCVNARSVVGKGSTFEIRLPAEAKPRRLAGTA
ncbi:hypothetical protein BH23CHL2_BH23CHL2_17090 [soil metagenome]